MPYHPDLTPAIVVTVPNDPPALLVGWLDAAYPYPQAHPPTSLLDRLWEYCQVPAFAMMGYHTCTLCSASTLQQETMLTRTYRGVTRALGSAELWVFDSHDQLYRAPDLIYHYVADHDYQPPDVFVQALLMSDSPTTEAYALRVLRRRFPGVSDERLRLRLPHRA